MIRDNTLEYAFPMRITSLAATTRHDFAAETLYNPHTNTRTFKHVKVEVWARSDATTATDLTAMLIGIKLGAVAFNDVTLSTVPPASGEHNEFYFSRDVTSYFNTNFGGASSQTCQVGVTFTGVATINIVVKITMTYKYQETGVTTEIKTARIPMDSFTGLLTTSLVEMGTNQIPQLTGGGQFPESSVVIRDWFLEIRGNERAQANTTDFALGIQIDSDTEFTEGTRQSDLGTSCAFVSIYSRKASVPTTTAAHALKFRCAAVTARFQFSVVLVVTYEYAASSTSGYNSLKIPMAPLGRDGQSVPFTGDSDTETQLYVADVWIEEPATITMRQSGIVFGLNLGHAGVADFTQTLQAGAGAERDYTVVKTASEVFGGPPGWVGHRIDSGGASGAALTLARGLNRIVLVAYNDHAIDWTTSGVENPSSSHAMLYLNYTSGKHQNGFGAHNHTIEQGLFDSLNGGSAVSEFQDVATGLSIETNSNATGFFINGIGLIADVFSERGPAPYIAIAAMADNTDFPDAGWVNLSAGEDAPSAGGNASGWGHLERSIQHLFTRWTQDPVHPVHPTKKFDDCRMSVITSRTWRRINWVEDDPWNVSLLITYHSCRWVETFNVLGFNGSGGGLEVTVHSSVDDDVVIRGTTASGGTFTFYWFDSVYAVWGQSSDGAEPTDRRGRSAAVQMSTVAA